MAGESITQLNSKLSKLKKQFEAADDAAMDAEWDAMDRAKKRGGTKADAMKIGNVYSAALTKKRDKIKKAADDARKYELKANIKAYEQSITAMKNATTKMKSMK